MSDNVVERLSELEEAVRRAAEAIGRLREEHGVEHAVGLERNFSPEAAGIIGHQRNAEHHGAVEQREARRLGDERRQILNQVDVILKDIAKLDLDRPQE